MAELLSKSFEGKRSLADRRPDAFKAEIPGRRGREFIIPDSLLAFTATIVSFSFV